MRKLKLLGIIAALLVIVPFIVTAALAPFIIYGAWIFGYISFEAAALLILIIIAYASSGSPS